MLKKVPGRRISGHIMPPNGNRSQGAAWSVVVSFETENGTSGRSRRPPLTRARYAAAMPGPTAPFRRVENGHAGACADGAGGGLADPHGEPFIGWATR